MLRIALSQLEIIPGRPDINTQNMLAAIAHARSLKADMVIFPEMSIPGYLLGDTWEQTAFLKDCEAYGKEIIKASDGICVLFGNVAIDWNKKGDDGRVRKYNAFFTAHNGKLCGETTFPYPFRIKTLQPNYREFDDERHFFSLRKLAVELGIPVHQLLTPVEVNLGGRLVKLGCVLCEDGWCENYPIKPIETIHQNGPADLYINISASPFTLGKNNKRNRIFSAQAREAGSPLIYVNNVGIQNNGKTVYTFDGCSTVYNRNGEIIAHCPSFEPVLHCVDLDLDSAGGSNGGFLSAPDDNNIGSIYQALCFGIDRFLRSIGTDKVVIGVSGGIDSAVTAALYARILKPENILLANMPSKFNSKTTKDLAARLSANLGCRYIIIPIQAAVEHTVNQIGSVLPVTPFMVENIQARDRSSRILAALAAAFGGVFTCNANKSELSVGYSTLYGDQAGFLAALADLWKHQVYELGSYLNEQVYGRSVIPREIFDLAPSAELSREQAVDEGKGDPLVYPYHDFLFRAFVEFWDKATPEDILLWYEEGILENKLGCESGLIDRLFHTPAEFIADLERWWKLFTGMAVAKRIQAPPVIAVSRRAFGFDHREAQNGTYFTAEYYKIKNRLLAK